MSDQSSLFDRNDSRLSNKAWRIRHLYKIKDIHKQIVKFVPNRAQAEFDEKKTHRNIILKSRKLGFTTYFSIDSLDDVLFKKNTDALMLSYDIPSQTDIFDDKIKLAWENLHPDLQALYELDADRANKLKFNWGEDSKGNKTTTSITVRLHGRSGTYHKLHISEFAKICKIDPAAAREIMSGTIQAVPLSGEVNIESTAEGDYGQFHDIFMEAWQRGEPKTPVDFKAFFFNWTYDDAELEKVAPMAEEDLPKEFVDYRHDHALSLREITYYYLKWLTLGRDFKMLHREYPTTVEEAFEASGDKFFDEASVEFQRQTYLAQGEPTGKWIYYEDYNPGHRYAEAVDPAGGFGGDNAVCVIMDFDWRDSKGIIRPKVVAVYADDQTKPDELAYVAKAGATRYGNCLIAVERNNHGHATLAILKGIYFNIYKERVTGRDGEAETDKLGWHSNSATKPRMLLDLRKALLEKAIAVPDGPLLSELHSFPADEATNFTKDDDGKHWDRVISLAIVYQMRSIAASMGKIIVEDSGGAFDKFSPFGTF